MGRRFDGAASACSLGTGSSLNIGGTGGSGDNFTLSAWIRLHSENSGNSRIICHYDLAGQASYQWLVASGRKLLLGVIRHESGAQTTVTGNTVLAVDRLYHVAATFENNASGLNSEPLRVFVDGKFDGLANPANAIFTLNPSTAPTTVGCIANGAGFSLFMDGDIFDAAIWKGAALNFEEIRALAAGVSPLQIKRSFLSAYLPLGNGDKDLSGNGNNATLSGGTTRSVPFPLQPPRLIRPSAKVITSIPFPGPFVPRVVMS